MLPGRVGELARVAVLTRRLDDGGSGLWPTLVGTVFAHRVFDLVPVGMLVVWVLVDREDPELGVHEPRGRARRSASALFLFAFASARHHGQTRLEGLGTVRRVVTMARHGLGVMRNPAAAAIAVSGQIAGWPCQLFAVWAAMQAFDIDEALPAAGLVLLLMNVATIVPLWPGNVGLVQVAIALPLEAVQRRVRARASRSASGCRRSRPRSASGSG